MKKMISIFKSLTLVIFLVSVVSCDKDEPDFEYNDEEDVVTSKVLAPSFDKYLTTTDYDGFSIGLWFKNGGDVRDNMSCQVYWKAYSKRPSSTPAEQDLTNCEQMRIKYHGETKTLFEKSHAGFNGGTYIYYYAMCKNSKGSCKTKITYTIIKRM